MNRVSSSRSISRSRLWFGLLGGHSAWTAQLLVSYLLVSLACAVEPGDFTMLGVGVFDVLLVLTNIGTAALAVLATGVAYRAWNRLQSTTQAERGRRIEVNHFMALSGFLLSGLFVVVILVTASSYFFVQPCG